MQAFVIANEPRSVRSYRCIAARASRNKRTGAEAAGKVSNARACRLALLAFAATVFSAGAVVPAFALTPPILAESLSASSVAVYGTVQLVFQVTNLNSNVTLSGVGFTDTLPAGLVVATPNGLAGACLGTITATAGSRSISLANAVFPPSSVCAFEVNVTAIGAGTMVNTTSAITSNEAGLGAGASATLNGTPITRYTLPIGTEPAYITPAADGGSFWFTEGNGAKIGTLTAGGTLFEFTLPYVGSGGTQIGIAVGSDGAAWFAENEFKEIVRITVSGDITQYATPSGASPNFITAGPDSALWFTEYFPGMQNGLIGRITTGGAFTEYPISTSGATPAGITLGPDGALWFVESIGKIGRITTAGNMTEYPIPSGSAPCDGIAAGPDGALWFTYCNDGKIGRITTGGVITEYPVPTSNSRPWYITAGPDGALWFTEDAGNLNAGNNIGRITTGGVVTEYPIPAGFNSAHPHGITAGPDGALWFTESEDDKIGRIPALGLSTVTHNFNVDGKSDILWRDTSGNVALWLMNGSQVVSSGPIASVPNSFAVVGQRDFDGDGDADLLWRDTSGNVYMWFMKGLSTNSSAALGNVPTTWTVKGTGDMNGDGKGDILWQDSSGNVAVWFMSGSNVMFTTTLGGVDPAVWGIAATDAVGDIFWRDSSGNLAVWRVTSGGLASTVSLGNVPLNWQIAGIGDFNADNNPDILFRDSNTGTLAIWFLNSSAQVQSTATVGTVPASSTWRIAQLGDYNGNGISDILWIDGSGNLAIWFMNAASIASTASLGTVGTSWTVQSANAE